MINVQYESLDFRKSSLDQKNGNLKKWEFKNILDIDRYLLSAAVS